MQQVSAPGAAPPPAGAAAGATAEPQRRERKKRQTRDALVRAALTLFNAKGYEQTAVREITDAVDVSERTFFRYFASKEDLVISFIRERTEVFVRSLAARPAAEEPLTIDELLAQGWEIAGYASGYDNRTSLILFRHPGVNALVQCGVLYDVTRNPRTILNCYELK